MTRTWSKSTLP